MKVKSNSRFQSKDVLVLPKLVNFPQASLSRKGVNESASTLVTSPSLAGRKLQSSAKQIPSIRSYSMKRNLLGAAYVDAAPQDREPGMVKRAIKNRSSFNSVQHPVPRKQAQSSNKEEFFKKNNPSMLLLQHNECKKENRERLKNVKNLEELINFKVVTVADKLGDLQRAEFSSPSLAQDDSIMSNAGPGNYSTIQVSQGTNNGTSITKTTSLDTLKRICDPLLANSSMQ